MTAACPGRRETLLQILAALAALTAPAARATPPDGDATRLTAGARLLAGLDPAVDDPQFARLTAQRVWREQVKACQAGAKKLRQRLETMDSWRRAHLDSAASGGTLVYPFSGPDFVNAYALFPECDHYVFFSLEEPGRPPALERMGAEQLERTLADVRMALNDLVHLNFFITPNMAEQVRTSSLRGVAPLLMAMLALLDLRIERFSRIEMWPERNAELLRLPPARRPRLAMQAIQVDFARAGSDRRQTLWYFSLDASDAELRHYPEFVQWLRDVRSPVVLLKSASYLLHGEGFKQVRQFILDRADLIVQDDTGLPYRMLSGAPWRVSLHGQYEQPVDLFKKRYQDDLAAAFVKAGAATSVPFPFGYNWRTRGNSFVIVARREPTST
jgi:hypothetical protein